MGSSTARIEAAENRCAQQGVKLTERRREVLSALIEAGGALSAYELLDRCNKRLSKSMPAMSIYRILDFLQSHSLVHKLKSNNKFIACAHIDCDHQHFSRSQFFICSDCPAVEEINIDTSAYEFMRRAAEQAGFSLSNTQLEFTGSCQRCTNNGGQPE